MKTFRNWSWQALLRALIKNLIIIVGISYLFYGTVLLAIPALLLLIPMMKKERIRYEEKKNRRFAIEFREALRSMRTAMHSGYAIENAMTESVVDLIAIYGDKSVIVREFKYMSNQIRLHIPTEDIWRGCAIRCNVEEVRNFADIFQIAKRSGGDLIAIMDHTAEAIGDKLEVEQELETVMASKKMEWKIMTLIPFFIILYMKLSFPEFMEGMYGNITGILVMTGALIMMLVAFLIGERITDIEM